MRLGCLTRDEGGNEVSCQERTVNEHQNPKNIDLGHIWQFGLKDH